MIQVENNVPIPKGRTTNIYPYKAMDVGDSFFIDDTDMQVVLNANWRASKRLNMKFTARKEGAGVRVWRIA